MKSPMIRAKVLFSVLAVFAAALIALGWRFHGSEPHSVTLNWQAPQGSRYPIVGYNVYRRTADGGQFVKIAEKVPNTHYEDRLVSTGREYTYAVTAVDQAGRESKYSAPFTVRVP